MNAEREDLRPPSRRPRVPLWARCLSSPPLFLWYALASLLAWLAGHVTHYRRRVIDLQLASCFPDLDDAERARIRRDYYRNFADVMVETVKALSISAAQVRARMRLVGADAVRRHVAAGRSVLIVTSHNCNWEWTLLILSLELGCPLDAAYKPMKDAWADRLLLAMRSRFGARMISAKKLLIHVGRRRNEPRVIAMVADQEPMSSTGRYFTSFFGRETAFFLGPETVARLAGAPVFFVAVERIRRGHYQVALEPLVEHDERPPEGAIVERYVRRVEQQICSSPPDWLWSHRRWKLRREPDGTVTKVRPPWN